jgi:hypothetical protein
MLICLTKIQHKQMTNKNSFYLQFNEVATNVRFSTRSDVPNQQCRSSWRLLDLSQIILFAIQTSWLCSTLSSQKFKNNLSSITTTIFPGPEKLHNHFHKNICFAQGRDSTHLSFLGQRHCTITFTSVFPGAETLLLCDQSLLGSIALSINLLVQ